MKVADRLLKEGVEAVSEKEFSDYVEEAKRSLEGRNLVEKDWDEFIVVGDTHGDLDAARIPAERAVKRDLPIVFLGDYVDRGREQIENLAYILELKKQRPSKTVLLRGNHETESMNRRYGFYRVVNTRYSSKLFDRILSLYRELPAAANIGDFFLCHGGIPRGIQDLEDIRDLSKTDERYKEIFWNDPSEDIELFERNYLRGAYNIYGEKAVGRFLERNSLSMLIRAHQCFPEGFKYFFDRKLLTIFSVPNYCGNREGKYALVKDGSVKLKSVK